MYYFLRQQAITSFSKPSSRQMVRSCPLAVINGDAKTVAKRKSTLTRKSMISDFESRKGFNIIIMSPIAVGVRLTVIGANNVIHFERHWNPAKEDQATDRIYRIRQTKDVNIYIPLLHHPKFEFFDVNLHKLLSKKRLLKDAIVTPEEVIPHPGGFSNDIMQPTDRVLARNLSKLSWQQFEALCAEVMSKQLKVDNCWLTQSVSDFGADVVVTFGNSGCLIQSKHTLKSRYLWYKAIQDIHSAKRKYELEIKKSFYKLIFITNAKTLSKLAINLAEQYEVQIMTFEDFEEMLITHSITLEQIINRLGKKRLHVG